MAEKKWQKHSEDWLRSLINGDQAAFAEFIDKYKETVFICCRRLGLREAEAEDVASETFLAAYQGLQRYQAKSQLSTWVWSIAYNKGVSYLRKNRREAQLLVEPDEQVADSGQRGPEAALVDREETETVWNAVERLPRLWAMAVVLHYREQKSVEDISKIMALNKNTVKTYLFRGRERLKELLGSAMQE